MIREIVSLVALSIDSPSDFINFALTCRLFARICQTPVVIQRKQDEFMFFEPFCHTDDRLIWTGFFHNYFRCPIRCQCSNLETSVISLDFMTFELAEHPQVDSQGQNYFNIIVGAGRPLEVIRKRRFDPDKVYGSFKKHVNWTQQHDDYRVDRDRDLSKFFARLA